MPNKPPTHKPSWWKPSERKDRDRAYNHGRRKHDPALAQRQRLRNSYRWQKVRRMVMARDHHLCRECARNGHTVPAVDVHHKDQELCRFFDMDNLESICRVCHAAESARERR